MEDPRMPAEPQDEEGTGSSYGDLVQEADVPRVGDEGVEGVDVKQASGESSSSSSSKSTSKKASD